MSTGHYEILGVLGRGGFGAVYHARFYGRHGFTQEVALKVVLPGAADDDLAVRLRDEARVLALVHHPNIVAVFRLCLLDQGWAVAMERVRGVDLTQLVAALGPLPIGAALEVVAQVAGALHYAYGQPGPDGAPLRAIHRDIKPDNLRITQQGIVKVLDFGIAHAVFGARESRTAADRVPGTMQYMAPERFEGGLGPEGDVYALGCVLYALLSGDVMGAARPDAEAHDAWVRKRIGRLADRRPEIPEDVLNGLYVLLRFDPAERPDAAAVERWARGAARACSSPALTELAPTWISQIGEPAPELEAGVVGDRWRELSAPSVASPEDATIDGETVFALSPPPAPRLAPAPEPRRVALVAVSTGPDPIMVSTAPRGVSERITWGHVTALALMLLVGFGAVGSRLLPTKPSAPNPPPEGPRVAPEPVAVVAEQALPSISADLLTPAPQLEVEAQPPVLVRVAGDAERVDLLRGDRRVSLPARVAVGEWTVSVRFPGATESSAKGTVVVRPGLQIRCESGFMTCTW